jgi:hypothetical protein
MRTLLIYFSCTTLQNLERLGLKGRKKVKKLKFFSIFEIFTQVEDQKKNVCACLTRLIKLDKKNNFEYILVGNLTRTLESKMTNLARGMSDEFSFVIQFKIPN